MKLQDSLRRGLSRVTDVMDDLVFGSAFKALTPKIILGKHNPSGTSIKSWETSKDIGGSSYCSYSNDNSLIFKGEVVFDEAISAKSRTIGGYVALRGLYENTIDLRDYSGVEVSMRSNVPITITLNMGCESHFVNDIFQFHLQVNNTSWQKYYIRFDNFVLTHGGKEAESTKEMDHLMLETIGFLIRNPNVPFELEVGEIAAIPCLDDKRTVKPIKRPFFEIPVAKST